MTSPGASTAGLPPGAMKLASLRVQILRSRQLAPMQMPSRRPKRAPPKLLAVSVAMSSSRLTHTPRGRLPRGTRVCRAVHTW